MLFLFAIGLLLVSGSEIVYYLLNLEPRLELTEEQQRAVFHVERGAAGVQGNVVYLDSPPQGRSVEYKRVAGLCRSRDPPSHRRLSEPRHMASRLDVLRVVAVIHLERSKVTVTTKDLRQMDVYSVMIDKLIHVERSPRRTN